MPENFEMKTPVPSMVFAIYYPPHKNKPAFLRSRISNVMEQFTPEYKMNDDCTILEIWKTGKVLDVMTELKLYLPDALIKCLFN